MVGWLLDALTCGFTVFGRTTRSLSSVEDVRTMALQAQRIGEYVAPQASGISGDELGFIYGDPTTPVTGVAVMWNAHSQSIGMGVVGVMRRRMRFA